MSNIDLQSNTSSNTSTSKFNNIIQQFAYNNRRVVIPRQQQQQKPIKNIEQSQQFDSEQNTNMNTNNTNELLKTHEQKINILYNTCKRLNGFSSIIEQNSDDLKTLATKNSDF